MTVDASEASFTSFVQSGTFRKPPPFDTPVTPQHSLWFEPALPGAIAKLSERQRAAVILVHGYSWTVTEVAEMWGVSFSTVQAHIDRGMKRLRAKLGVDDG